jgi:hypothetical protein
VSNLTLACRPCNQKKNNRDVREFLAAQPVRLKRVLAHAKAPLRDASFSNGTFFSSQYAQVRFHLLSRYSPSSYPASVPRWYSTPSMVSPLASA